ncbi:hypothetical protein TEA_023533 [Camellia sinensis var. sinensis]|uniref:Uncharacterized protein n=1 Tax=Camellia sinensis var. sinensis TaxID=542762 RepID=A0A4V3WJ46_CAMSN|nr:hypothetical protein TEA_023533 [Camellia sinensis var. sinensis]
MAKELVRVLVTGAADLENDEDEYEDIVVEEDLLLMKMMKMFLDLSLELLHGYGRWQAIVDDKDLKVQEVICQELNLPVVTLPVPGASQSQDGANVVSAETPMNETKGIVVGNDLAVDATNRAPDAANRSQNWTKRDISIIQCKGSKTGTPEYIVEIVDTCLSVDFLPSNIHLHCGQFASANLVNPQNFKRPSIDDCLMNGGKPLKASQVIRFSYFNSDDAIKFLQFVYVEYGSLVLSEPLIGCVPGSNFNTVRLNYPDEFLASITGSYTLDPYWVHL